MRFGSFFWRLADADVNRTTGRIALTSYHLNLSGSLSPSFQRVCSTEGQCCQKQMVCLHHYNSDIGLYCDQCQVRVLFWQDPASSPHFNFISHVLLPFFPPFQLIFAIFDLMDSLQWRSKQETRGERGGMTCNKGRQPEPNHRCLNYVACTVTNWLPVGFCSSILWSTWVTQCRNTAGCATTITNPCPSANVQVEKKNKIIQCKCGDQ